MANKGPVALECGEAGRNGEEHLQGNNGTLHDRARLFKNLHFAKIRHFQGNDATTSIALDLHYAHRKNKRQ